jgi:phosphatidylserine/phosphatidylglycerophosphate/cardiolipin synthase-like enzyme
MFQSSSDVEFVITSPPELGDQTPYIARARTTIGVLTSIIARARKRLVFSAPFIQLREGLTSDPLAGALEAAVARGVAVEIATATQYGLDSIARGRLALGRDKVRLFQPSVRSEGNDRLGSHAKFAANDANDAYIGSANFTRRGLTEHLEMGVLVRGSVARQVMQFWDFLLLSGFFREWKMER